jgi:hypothetical protein
MIPPENPRTSAAKTQSSGPMADLSHPPGRITPEALLFENRARDGCPLRTRWFPAIPRHSAITFDGERHETVLPSHLVKRESRIQPVVSLHLS